MFRSTIVLALLLWFFQPASAYAEVCENNFDCKQISQALFAEKHISACPSWLGVRRENQVEYRSIMAMINASKKPEFYKRMRDYLRPVDRDCKSLAQAFSLDINEKFYLYLTVLPSALIKLKPTR